MKKNKKTFADLLKGLYRFLVYDIWQLTEAELSRKRRLFYRAIKTFFLSIRGFYEDKLQTKASALTFYSLLAIVPVLALLLGIGKGFGFQDIMVDWVAKQVKVQAELLPYVFTFVEQYLSQARGGIVLGIGLLVLLWSVISVFMQVENTFNDIWQVKKKRHFFRQVSIYFSLMLVLPVLIILSAGLSVYISSAISESFFFGLFSPVLKVLVKMAPFFINWIVLTILYIIIPNTKVRFTSAVLAGVVAGTLFQFFQLLYINGQIYLSRYNAVYGSFAALPLLMLWLQMSWLIVLFGAELSFAGQNVDVYELEKKTQKISRRYRDFVTLIITKMIVKRFEAGEKPYTAQQLSKNNQIPIRLVTNALHLLTEIGLLSEIYTSTAKEKAYQPAIDIHQLTVAMLFDKMERYGSENFKLDEDERFHADWERLLDIKKKRTKIGADVLIKDL